MIFLYRLHQIHSTSKSFIASCVLIFFIQTIYVFPALCDTTSTIAVKRDNVEQNLLVCRQNILNKSSQTERCKFVKSNKTCKYNSGFIQYLEILYCNFSSIRISETIIIIWLILLVCGFATIADSFFGPSLIALARSMKMSQNLAGLTLLAFGNGSPDVFSSILAIVNGDPNVPDDGLGITSLISSGLLVNTITAGLVILIRPSKINKNLYIKDTLFYIGAIIWCTITLARRDFTLYDSIGFLIYYFVFVITAWSLDKSIYRKVLALMRAICCRGSKNESNMSANKKTNNTEDTKQNGINNTASYMAETETKKPSILRTILMTFQLKKKSENNCQQLKANGHCINCNNKENDAILISFRQGETNSKEIWTTKTEPFTKVKCDANSINNHLQHDDTSCNNIKELQIISPNNNFNKLAIPCANQNLAKRYSSMDAKEFLAYQNSNLPIKSKHNCALRNAGSFRHRPSLNDFQPFMVQWIIDLEEDGGHQNMPCLLNYESSLNSNTFPSSIDEVLESKSRLEKSPNCESNIQHPTLLSPNNNINKPARMNNSIKLSKGHTDRSVDTDEEYNQSVIRQYTNQSSQATLCKDIETDKYIQWASKSMWHHFFYTICPISLSKWPGLSGFVRILHIAHAPLVLIFRLTIPVVYEEFEPIEKLITQDNIELEEQCFESLPTENIQLKSEGLINEHLDIFQLHGWCKLLNGIQCLVSPTLWVMLINVNGHPIGLKIIGNSGIPIIAVIFPLCIILFILIMITSYWNKLPVRYHRPLFGTLGFITSIVWIYAIAQEFVDALQALGIAFNMSEAILGITVMAFANSIGDIISNGMLAYKGHPQIAYAACVGGPIFNLLLGVGISFTIKISRSTTKHSELKLTLAQIVLITFVLGVLIFNLIINYYQKYELQRPQGIILIIIYLFFMTIVILIETNIILEPSSWKLYRKPV